MKAHFPRKFVDVSRFPGYRSSNALFPSIDTLVDIARTSIPVTEETIESRRRRRRRCEDDERGDDKGGEIGRRKRKKNR